VAAYESRQKALQTPRSHRHPRATLLTRRVSLLVIEFILIAASLAPQAAEAGHWQPYTSSLDNGVIKVGIDSSIGGAISYLSPSGSGTNYINVYDRGRAVQQSYYAGPPFDRRAEGQNAKWSPWQWNPIIAGDSYGNRATVLSSSVTSTTMYVKTQPLLWDMYRSPCQCVFETWITLEGRRVRVHNKLTTFRTDNRWNLVTNPQELPAAYPIADLSHVISYTGGQPFTWGATSEIPKSTTWVWSQWRTPENWGACVDANNFGVGVYTPGRTSFLGGRNRYPSGGSSSFDTCYLSPIEGVALDKTSTFEYDYWLVVGTVGQIRRQVYALHESQPSPPSGFPAGDGQTWNFDAYGDRGGWWAGNGIGSLSVNGGDLKGTSTGADPYMFSAPTEKPAQDDQVVVGLRNGTPSSSAQLFFTTARDPTWTATKSKRIAIVPNSRFTAYRFDMSHVPGWAGKITGLRLDPIEAAGSFALDWIRIGNF
jgi:hypothetical protein